MKKTRILAWVLALSMMISLCPADAKASTLTADNTAAVETVMEADAAAEDTAVTETAEESEDTAAAADVTGAEETEVPAVNPNSYDKLKLADLQDENLLQIPEEMQELTVEKNEAGSGLMFTGKGELLSAGRITISQLVNFDQNAVGRVSVDALVSKGAKVSLEVYLDDAEEPLATFSLTRQKKTSRWTDEGDLTANVLEQNITGEHSVSFRIVSDSSSDISVLLRSIEFVQSSLPTVYLNIDETEGTIAAMNADESHETECYGDMTVQVPDGYVSEYSGKTQKTETYSMEYIRGRGNSTWTCDKKPYKIKLDKKADLLGMGKNKHWVLLANRFDNSKMRNKMTYWLGTELGMEFTPKCVFVDVVMNGKYLGSYYLCEQVRVGSNRVDIDDLEESEETMQATDLPTISGGYLLSMFPYGDEDKKSFTTTRSNQFLIESPEFDGYENDAQYNYIKDYVQKTEDAIYGDDFKDADGVSYADYMDVDSAVDYYWVQEISMNGDAFGSTSTYLYKKRDGKLYWGPLWDFDYVAWASYEYNTEYASYEGFQQTGATWFARLLKDPTFVQKMVDRWPTIKEKLLEITAEGGLLDQYAEQLEVSEKYDLEKWYPYFFDELSDTPLTFQQEVDRLRTWINNRVNWIDANLSTLVPTPCTVTFKNQGKVVKTINTTTGSTIASFPTVASRKGYVFGGWYVQEGDYEYRAELGTEGFYVYDNMVLAAKWVKESEVVPVENIYFGRSKVGTILWDYGDEMMMDAQTFIQTCEVYPYDATVTDLTWTTSNPKVATVDSSGTVSLVGYGTVKITATAASGVSASYKLKVYSEDQLDNYWSYVTTMDKTSMTLETDHWGKINLTNDPAYSADDSDALYWISTDAEVADVTITGVVLANMPGTATILCINTNNGSVGTCKVTVKKAAKKGDTFTKSGLKYKVTSNVAGNRTLSCIGRSDSSLKKVTVPDTVTRNGVTYKVTSIGSKAFKSTGITYIKVGANVKTIGTSAFEKCTKLTKAVIGDGTKTIGTSAFANCTKLAKVSIGTGLKTINKSAFSGCKKLATVTIRSTKLTTVGTSAFKGIDAKAVFKVPSSAKTAYKKLIGSKAGFTKKMTITA